MVDVKATMNWGPDGKARSTVRSKLHKAIDEVLKKPEVRKEITGALTRWLVGGPWDVHSVARDQKDLVIEFIEPPRDQVLTPFPEKPQKPLKVGKLSNIDHIVVLMMENRSFDHMLGYLKLTGVRPKLDGLTGKETNTLKNKSYPVFHLSGTGFEIDPCHNHHCVLTQIGSATMGGFVGDFAGHIPAEKVGKVSPGMVMGYYDAGDVPVYDALAREFAICDKWFCAFPGGTWPNRFFTLTGRLDRDQSERHTYVNPSMVTFAPIQTKSIFDHLLERNISWRYYEHGYCFIRLFHRWTTDLVHVRPAKDFFADAAAGKLPSVSFIDPDFIEYPPANDDHAPADVRDGQRLIARIVNALMKGPAWSKTLFVITYDEHGGFFDHVVPPKAANVSGVDELGPRVPAVVVSPWVERGAVASKVFDHTSILKTIIRRFCAAKPPDMGARVAAANDLELLLTRAKARADVPVIGIPTPSGRSTQPAESLWETAAREGRLDLDLSEDFHALLALTRARYGIGAGKPAPRRAVG